MEKIKIEVLNAGGEVLAEYSGSEEAAFVYDRPYCEGDRIRIEAEPKNSFWWIQVDDAVGKSMVYLTGKDLRLLWDRLRVCDPLRRAEAEPFSEGV